MGLRGSGDTFLFNWELALFLISSATQVNSHTDCGWSLSCSITSLMTDSTVHPCLEI